MTDLGGGGVAAFGFSYQYLQTVEVFLTLLRENPDLIPRATLVVEPLHQNADGEDDDVVDFAIEVDGEVLYSIQVKSSSEPDKNPLQPAPARKALEPLIAYPALNTLLLTNKPISPGLLDEVEVVPAGTADTRTAYTWSKGPRRGPDDSGAQPNIVVDTRPPVELRNSIAELIRYFRGQRKLGQGEVSARLLCSILLDHIFSTAAGEMASRITAPDLLEMLAMPDARIAHVAGGFDWGLAISNIPNYLATVPRVSYLDRIHDHLAPDDAAAEPSRVVLTGLTGNGKTVLASDYCRIEALSYEFICWIDCREIDLIEPQVRNLVGQLTKDKIAPDSAVGAVFAGILGRRPGPWLLVLDGIQDRSRIEEYIPSRGHGSILVTSNNSLNWWPGAEIIEVGEFSDDEAVDCFATYAGIAAGSVDALRDSILDIVNRVGRVPVAVGMTGIYFKNTEGQLSELALQYFQDLEALSDSQSIPPGFNRTAFAAIRYAVRSLGAGSPAADSYGRSARAVVEIGALLAPELLPLNLMLLATPEYADLNLAVQATPQEVDQVLRRGVLAMLRTQTIGRRVVNDGGGQRTPASETIAIHPLVHEILQRSYLAEVPPGQLQVQCAVLMHYLRGWLERMRDQGEYFAVEQLRLHANALLALVKRNEPLSSNSHQERRVYTYAKSFLEGELSTCAASRGDLEEALALGSAALQGLSSLLGEPLARIFTVKILANMIADLSIGEAPPEVISAFANRIVPMARQAESDDDSGVRGIVYTVSGDTLSYLNRLEVYRDSPLLRPAREALREIVDRDPDRDSREAAQMAQLNELYGARRFAELLDLVPGWRASNKSLENAAVIDGVEIVCQLRTDAKDDAIAGIDRLVGKATHANYELLSLVEALGKVGRELQLVIADGSHEASRDRLQLALNRVLERRSQLADAAAGNATKDDGDSPDCVVDQ